MKLPLKLLSYIFSFVAIAWHYLLIAQDTSPWLLPVAVAFLPLVPLFLFLPGIMWVVLRSYPKSLPLVDFLFHLAFYALWVIGGLLFLSGEWGAHKFAGYGLSIAVLAASIGLALWRLLRKATLKEWLGRHRRTLGTFGVVGIVLLLTYVAVDVPARERFSHVPEHITTIDKSIATAGGQQKGIVHLQGSGSVWQRYGCGLLYSCPFIAGEWVVPIDPNDKSALARELFAKTNFPHGPNNCSSNATDWFCYLEGSDTDFKMTIELWPSDQPPAQDITPKVWANVRVTIQAGAQ